MVTFFDPALQRFRPLAVGGSSKPGGGCTEQYSGWWNMGLAGSWNAVPNADGYKWHYYPRTQLLHTDSGRGEIVTAGIDHVCGMDQQPCQKIVTANPQTHEVFPVQPADVGIWHTNNAVLLHTLLPGWEWDTVTPLAQYHLNRLIGTMGSDTFTQMGVPAPGIAETRELTMGSILPEGPATPVWVEKADASVGRIFSNAVHLPDGSLVVVGGQNEEVNGGDGDTVYRSSADRFDPQEPESSGIWNTLATTNPVPGQSFSTPRGYHSVALLLPDGSVALMGGQQHGGGSPLALSDPEDTVDLQTALLLPRQPPRAERGSPGDPLRGALLGHPLGGFRSRDRPLLPDGHRLRHAPPRLRSATRGADVANPSALGWASVPSHEEERGPGSAGAGHGPGGVLHAVRRGRQRRSLTREIRATHPLTERPMSTRRVCFLVAPFLSPPIHGQETLRSYVDLWTTPFIATPLATVDDVDGDGLPDMILGDSNAAPFGEVRLFSGVSGSHMRTLTLNNFRLGNPVLPMGDVTGDGEADFMASGDIGGRGHLWNGATLELAWSGPWFDSGATIGDIDDDGIRDFVLAGFGFFGLSGSAKVYYGGRYTEAYSLVAPGAVHYGTATVALNDIDGDGIGDFAIGAPGSWASDLICVPGEVYVHSGVDGHLLYRLEGEGVDSDFGKALASPGDVNGDGLDDLVVGASYCCTSVCDGGRGQGRVSFYDGPSGQLLGHVLPDPLGTIVLGQLGARLTAVGDLDGNGYPDVMTNFSPSYGDIPDRHVGTLLALDGNSREPIYRVWNAQANVCPGFGVQFSIAGDVNGDDFPDYYVSSACGAIGVPDDHVDLISGAPIGVRSLGGRCGDSPFGRQLRIGATGVPEVGRDFPIHLSGLVPGASARLLLGDLKSDRLLSAPTSCRPLVRPSETRELLAREVRPGEGVASATLAIPNDARLIGLKLHAQWVVDGTPRPSTSRVLEIEIQPSNPMRGW